MHRGARRFVRGAPALLFVSLAQALPAQGRTRTDATTSDPPRATLLYQNFPNPFPAGATAHTCIWFDLHAAGEARLTVLDTHGNPVKAIVPGGQLGAGRYGRLDAAGNAGCDPRYTWDGTDDSGRIVARGAYLIRLTTPWYTGSKRVLFLGR